MLIDYARVSTADQTIECPCMITTSPGSLSFLEALRPPMEERGRADALGLALESRTVRQLPLLQLLDALDMAVDQRRIG